jgi:hypothetical protein
MPTSGDSQPTYPYLRGTAACLLGFLVIGLLAFIVVLSYLMASCEPGDDPAGWAFFIIALGPLAFPPLAVLWLAAAVFVGLAGRPFNPGTRFWKRLLGVMAGTAATGVFVAIVALSFGVHETCHLKLF